MGNTNFCVFFFACITASLQELLTNSGSSTVSECEFVEQCSQICTKNLTVCQCIDGFKLGANEKSCHPLEPYFQILFHTPREIGLIDPYGSVQDAVSMERNPKFNIFPVALTYDVHRQVVYWINDTSRGLHSSTSPTQVFRNGIDKRTMPGHMSNRGILSPRSIAFDWIARNLYYIEPSLSAITACSTNVEIECVEILSRESLTTARSITLHSNLGFMFWIEQRDKTVIMKAGMDGSSVLEIFASSRFVIKSIAVDQGGARLYWFLEGDHQVASSDFDGNKKWNTNAAQSQNQLQKMDVFGQYIFWIGGPSQQGQSVQRVDKFRGLLEENRPNEIRITPNPIDIKNFVVYHSANQPVLRKNPCTDDVSCSGLCVLSPVTVSPGHRCISCAVSPQKYMDGRSISYGQTTCMYGPEDEDVAGDYDELAIAHENYLAIGILNHERISQPHVKFERVIKLPHDIAMVTGIVYNPINKMYILTDSAKIYMYDVKAKHFEILVENETHGVLSVGMDKIGGNLYWIDKGGGLNAMSVASRHNITLRTGLQNVCDMMIIPERRLFVLAVRNVSGGVNFQNYLMNGSKLISEYHELKPMGCITMAYDHSGGNILWSEIGEQSRIDRLYLTLNGTFSYASPIIPPHKPAYFPGSIGTYGSTTLWVDSANITVNRLEARSSIIFTNQILPEGEKCRAKYKSSAPIKLLVINRTRNGELVKMHNNSCNMLNCSHVCLVKSLTSLDNGTSAECQCFSGFNLEADGRTCTRQAGDMNTSNDNPKGFNSTDNTGTATGAIKLPLVPIAAACALLICIVGGVVIFYQRRKRRKQALTDIEIQEFFKGSRDKTATIISVPYDNHTWEVAKDSFRIEGQQTSGRGDTGAVQKVSLVHRRDQVVTIMKTCEIGSKTSLKSLLSELKVMLYLGRHENLVNFIGAYTQELSKGLAHVFVEYCENGSLLAYLRREEPATPPTLDEMNQWSREISNGMAFLAEKKVVHGSLSAKNVLLTADKTAKISEFGMCESLYNQSGNANKNREALPWRWMAPESLYRMEFTEKSDVWAFGVTLWEIHSFGSVPYPGMPFEINFASHLVNGLRLRKPDNCEDNFYSIMLNCWTIEADLRPNFTQLKQQLIDHTACSYMIL